MSTRYSGEGASELHARGKVYWECQVGLRGVLPVVMLLATVVTSLYVLYAVNGQSTNATCSDDYDWVRSSLSPFPLHVVICTVKLIEYI